MLDRQQNEGPAMLKLIIAAIGLLTIGGPAFAQHAVPYAGMEQRHIKALSDQQLADLRAGRGMGLALPAELNGYPGPLHVIELADQLGLSLNQLDNVREQFSAMKADAVPLGEKLIRQEAELDRLFASKAVTPESLASATREIGATQADLRNAHLKYHLTTSASLTPDQMVRYSELRGYAPNTAPNPHRHHRE